MPATTTTRRRRTATRASQAVHGETLIQRLFLLRWLHAQFGFPTPTNDLNGDAATKQLLETLRESREDVDANGLSHIAQPLLSRARPPRKISDEALRTYDENVRRHLYTINENRSEHITLRYFQHLALLYTEHLLDRLFSGPEQLCKEVNEFVQETKLTGAREFPRFTSASLRKLAFMMATGSGKTLLLHITCNSFITTANVLWRTLCWLRRTGILVRSTSASCANPAFRVVVLNRKDRASSQTIHTRLKSSRSPDSFQKKRIAVNAWSLSSFPDGIWSL
jgi:hypothetical protein